MVLLVACIDFAFVMFLLTLVMLCLPLLVLGVLRCFAAYMFLMVL